MLAFIVDIAVPAVAFVLMLIVGLELHVVDFLRALKHPRTVLIATLGQVLLLPLLAIIIVRLLSPDPTIALGVLFLALSPGGPISNYYSHLTGKNAALSVTLTAVSILFSLISIPVTAGIYLGLMGLSSEGLIVPAITMFLQLGAFIVLPTLLGMWLGGRFEKQFSLWQGTLRILSLGLVMIILGASIWTVREEFVARLPELILLASIFTSGAVLTGAILAKFVVPEHRHVVTIECTVRNIPVAVLLASGIAKTPAFAGFIAAYFLIEVLIMLPYAFWVRQQRAILV